MADQSFDLFRIGTGSAKWLESAPTLQAAHQRVLELSIQDFCDYLIVDFNADRMIRVSYLGQTAQTLIH
jgi:hypothetical protein